MICIKIILDLEDFEDHITINQAFHLKFEKNILSTSNGLCEYLGLLGFGIALNLAEDTRERSSPRGLIRIVSTTGFLGLIFLGTVDGYC